MDKENIIKCLKECTECRPDQLSPDASKLFEVVMDVIDERDKYKALYENEKDHSDTLYRIIQKLLVGGNIGDPNILGPEWLKPPYKFTCDERGDVNVNHKL